MTLFRYHSVTAGLQANAARLAEFLAQRANAGVHLVGHSLGGLVILEALARHSVACGRIVCLGSPLNGSGAATAVAGWPSGRRIIGKSLEEHLSRGAATAPAGREIGIVAGSRSFGTGRFFGNLSAPNDGTVTVEETSLAGAADHLVSPYPTSRCCGGRRGFSRSAGSSRTASSVATRSERRLHARRRWTMNLAHACAVASKMALRSSPQRS